MRRAGFTLIEVLIACAVFVIVALPIYSSYATIYKLLGASRVSLAANDLATEQFEIIRNMPYANVGLISGVPSGTLPRTQTFIRDGFTFQSTTTIQNVNDPFDSNPNNADYKFVQFDIACTSCRNFSPLSFSGQVAPVGLNTSIGNGSLFVNVLDADGNAVPDANIQIVNTTTTPQINIQDQTDTTGMYHLIDTPASGNSYHIIVSKPGYSTAQTYPPGGVNNPDPVSPDVTVVNQQLTQTSLAIDKVSTMNISTVLPDCSAVPDVTYAISGAKTIGTDNSGNPIYKYSSTQTSDSSGNSILSNMEWDSYSMTLSDANYDLAGSISQLPITLAPNTTQNVLLVVAPKNPKSIMFSVKDAATGLPLTNSTVTLTGSGYSNSLVTSQGYFTQTDWSGGSGATNGFSSTDGNIEYTAVPGQLTLKKSGSAYAASGMLISPTFDTASTTNFYQLLWDPTAQPTGAGTPNIRFQIATNNDSSTWNFTGPDGTAGTYYDSTHQTISASNNGNRFLRYELLMNTASSTTTPIISDVSFTYNASCVPPGQVLFSGLGNNTYTYTISRSGYQTTTGTITINASSPNWQNQNILLQSQ